MAEPKNPKTPKAEPGAPKAEEKGGVPGIRVTAKSGKFRRAGLLFTAEPYDLVLSALTDQQVADIRNEPELVVVDIEIDLEAK